MLLLMLSAYTVKIILTARRFAAGCRAHESSGLIPKRVQQPL